MSARVLWLLLTAGLLTIGGCHSRSVSHYVPEDKLARQALETVLDAWKANGSPEQTYQVENGPSIQVVDFDWRDGKKLRNFEIVSAEPAQPEEPKRFNVKLTYDGESAPIETVYHVVGNDPLWVFSNDGYNKTTGM